MQEELKLGDFNAILKFKIWKKKKIKTEWT